MSHTQRRDGARLIARADCLHKDIVQYVARVERAKADPSPKRDARVKAMGDVLAMAHAPMPSWDLVYAMAKLEKPGCERDDLSKLSHAIYTWLYRFAKTHEGKDWLAPSAKGRRLWRLPGTVAKLS